MDREEIRRLVAAVAPAAVAARRHLHQYPELSFAEAETAAFVASRLQELGYEPAIGVGGHGVKAVLRGGAAPRAGVATIALRADMDALPIQEETGLPFASRRPGIMHACGHDVHTAVLLGTADALAQVRDQVPGNVVLIFQPGEETNPGGASLMIRDGVLLNPPVDAIFGLHIHPGLAVGRMAFGAGPQLAAPDQFEVTVQGRGGHGAAPHQTIDPVLVAAQVVVALQSVVARSVNPLRPAVVTVGSIHGGSKHNIIPDEVVLFGTIRSMDDETRRTLATRVEAVVRGVCDAFGARHHLRYQPGYPVLVNEERMTAVGRQAGTTLLGTEFVADMEPTMGGEDFAFYLQQVPGTFARLGVAHPGQQEAHGLHTSRLNPNEDCIPVGIGYYLSLVLGNEVWPNT